MERPDSPLRSSHTWIVTAAEPFYTREPIGLTGLDELAL